MGDNIFIMYGYIYKITNLIDNKFYIGKHKVKNDKFDEKYWGSGFHLKRAIKLYGKDNFNREVLEWCDSLETLNQRESFWIKELDSRNPDVGYNIKDGGDGGWEIDVSGQNNPMYGVHRYGKDNPNFGHKWSEESRQKMRETIRNNGGRHGQNLGFKWTEEQKENLKKSKLDENGNYKYVGERAVNYGKHETHPCFGLYWWSNGVDNPIKSKECPGKEYHRGRK